MREDVDGVYTMFCNHWECKQPKCPKEEQHTWGDGCKSCSAGIRNFNFLFFSCLTCELFSIGKQRLGLSGIYNAKIMRGTRIFFQGGGGAKDI